MNGYLLDPGMKPCAHGRCTCRLSPEMLALVRRVGSAPVAPVAPVTIPEALRPPRRIVSLYPETPEQRAAREHYQRLMSEHVAYALSAEMAERQRRVLQAMSDLLESIGFTNATGNPRQLDTPDQPG